MGSVCRGPLGLGADPDSKHWFTTSFIPSTTAVFGYAIGPRKLSANEQFLVGAQTVVSLLQTTQIIIRRLFYVAVLLTPPQIKPKSFESTRNSFLYPGWTDASHVYVRAWTLGCFHSLTPSIAFGHLPPNSARFSYATEGALFISTQLSTDAVNALRKVRVLI